MTKSATDVMHDIVFAALIDGVMALRTASGGLPNTLLRDLNAIHANTTFADLPKDVQAAITANVRSAFTRLLREGYSVTSGTAPPPREPAPRRDGPGRPPSQRPRPDNRRREPGPGRPAGPRPPRGDKPKPR
jgi:hypothetical protein